MKAPTYITYSEKVPNQHSRMPATPAAKAKMRAPLAFLSAAAPSTTLKMAWPTIMTEVMRRRPRPRRRHVGERLGVGGELHGDEDGDVDEAGEDADGAEHRGLHDEPADRPAGFAATSAPEAAFCMEAP